MKGQIWTMVKEPRPRVNKTKQCLKQLNLGSTWLNRLMLAFPLDLESLDVLILSLWKMLDRKVNIKKYIYPHCLKHIYPHCLKNRYPHCLIEHEYVLRGLFLNGHTLKFPNQINNLSRSLTWEPVVWKRTTLNVGKEISPEISFEII